MFYGVIDGSINGLHRGQFTRTYLATPAGPARKTPCLAFAAATPKAPRRSYLRLRQRCCGGSRWRPASRARQILLATSYPSAVLQPGMAVRDSDGLGGGSDSDEFGRIPSSPAGHSFAVFDSLYGHFDPTELGSRIGRIR
jgi:hypothetical protein